MVMLGYVGLCRAIYGYVGLCKAIESNVCHILANGEPLYDAYTTYLPKSFNCMVDNRWVLKIADYGQLVGTNKRKFTHLSMRITEVNVKY